MRGYRWHGAVLALLLSVALAAQLEIDQIVIEDERVEKEIKNDEFFMGHASIGDVVDEAGDPPDDVTELIKDGKINSLKDFPPDAVYEGTLKPEAVKLLLEQGKNDVLCDYLFEGIAYLTNSSRDQMAQMSMSCTPASERGQDCKFKNRWAEKAKSLVVVWKGLMLNEDFKLCPKLLTYGPEFSFLHRWSARASTDGLIKDIAGQIDGIHKRLKVLHLLTANNLLQLETSDLLEVGGLEPRDDGIPEIGNNKVSKYFMTWWNQQIAHIPEFVLSEAGLENIQHYLNLMLTDGFPTDDRDSLFYAYIYAPFVDASKAADIRSFVANVYKQAVPQMLGGQARKLPTKRASKPRIAVVSSRLQAADMVHSLVDDQLKALAKNNDLTLVSVCLKDVAGVDNKCKARPPHFKRVISLERRKDSSQVDYTPLQDEEFDLAIFPDAILEKWTLELAVLPVAPLQASGPLSPISTNVDTMQYVVVGRDLISKPSVQRSFSERLVSVPGLGLSIGGAYDHWKTLRNDTFAELDLNPENTGNVTYFDVLVPWMHGASLNHLNLGVASAIYQQALPRMPKDLNFFFVFFSSDTPNGPASKMAPYVLLERFGNSEVGVAEEEEGITFLKEVAAAKFVLGDPWLDNPSTTVLDCLVVGTPVVALKGKLPSECFTAAVLERAGLSELVGHTQSQYINIAKKLATDMDFRLKVTEKIHKLDLDALFQATKDEAHLVQAVSVMLQDSVSGKPESTEPIFLRAPQESEEDFKAQFGLSDKELKLKGDIM
eukprot:CAMPEP_0177633674 /NCGR_PEP_ID=MMETSP0447-20121125/2964_1 /TAXON_ID=0 /ORGANISM="Stygamoeba regulata, Strain BSH-02190019" /LENGTH=771 /DNA_ID=CAMNT_0019135351 /DNA_START=35 /DNA_END=2350 /DNA_ORIENTATION=-